MGYLSGTGVGDWRGPYRRERQHRMTAQQQQRLAELESTPNRTRHEEIQFRTLSWFTDHADPVEGWRLALAQAGTESEINFKANRALMAETDRWPLAGIFSRARQLAMPCWFIHGGQDPRSPDPVAALATAVPRSRMHVIEDAGHEPWHERPDQLRELLTGLLGSP
jgi:proline iminopeptidase